MEEKKYSLFYPENSERVPGAPEFDTPLDAFSHWMDKRPSWKRIASTGDDYAMVDPRSGTVVVVRNID